MRVAKMRIFAPAVSIAHHLRLQCQPFRVQVIHMSVTPQRVAALTVAVLEDLGLALQPLRVESNRTISINIEKLPRRGR